MGISFCMWILPLLIAERMLKLVRFFDLFVGSALVRLERLKLHMGSVRVSPSLVVLGLFDSWLVV